MQGGTFGRGKCNSIINLWGNKLKIGASVMKRENRMENFNWKGK